MEVLVEYDYASQNPDELSIKKGERIRNVHRKEEGWYEGELVSNGRRGVFPDNFVKPLKSNVNGIQKVPKQQVKTPENLKQGIQQQQNNNIGFIIKSNEIQSNGNQMKQFNNNNNGQPILASSSPPLSHPSNNNNSNINNKLNPPLPMRKPLKPHNSSQDLFSARVLYSYVPINEDELAIQENDIVKIIRLVEDGWYEGISHGRQGVFPSNYVEKVSTTEAPGNPQISLNNNLNSQSNESLNSSQSFNMINENSIIPPNDSNTLQEGPKTPKKNKKVLGIGFGNIFSGKTIELKTKENFSHNTEKVAISQQQQQNRIEKGPTTQQHITSPPSSSTPNNAGRNKKIKATVLFDYFPTQPDELKLMTGEVIYILDKYLEDEGWWRGESITTGRVGVFPDNFVEEIIDMNTGPSSEIVNSNVAVVGQMLFEPILVNSNGGNTLSSSAKRGGGGKQAIQLHSNSNPIINNGMQTTSSTHIIDYSNPSSLTTSSTSTSSSKDSLIRQTHTQPKTAQLTTPQNGTFSKQSFDNNNENSKSQSDISEDMDEDLQRDHKLTHIKKTTRQFNKRPPSFRSKTNNSDTNSEIFSTKKKEIPLQPSITAKELNNKSPTSDLNLTGSFADELALLKLELDTVRQNSFQTQFEYKNVQTELNDIKKSHESQMNKMEKKMFDLISEIDEEKKTRLALQVELERLKKTIMNN